MLNFTYVVLEEKLEGLTDEIDYAEWFLIDEARERMKKNSLAQFILENCISKNRLK